MIQIKCKDNSLSFHDLMVKVVIVIVVVVLKSMVWYRHLHFSSSDIPAAPRGFSDITSPS